MAKAKKFTIGIFENRSLKEKDFSKGVYYPLYLTLSFNRKNKTIKSLTYELLNDLNSRAEVLMDDHEEVEKNDRRILENYRKYVESQGIEFSLELISPDNEDYVKLKVPVFEFVGGKVKWRLYSFFQGPDNKFPLYPNAQLLSWETYNWDRFLHQMKEISPKFFQDFMEENEDIEKIFHEIKKLDDLNLWPYLIDLKTDNPIFQDLKKAIEGL
jgi:hypothetical protein